MITLAFICGSVEPGRDGVGDYTLRFARELVRQGHHIGVMAVYDRHVTKDTAETRYEDGLPLQVLRIPATYNPGKKFSCAKRWLDQLNPQLVSLQYVPYAFHNKGLPWAMTRLFGKLGRRRHWHIMFHESWIGVPHLYSIKALVTATLQQLIIRNMVRQLQPVLVHATIPATARRLQTVGCRVKELPLFSNIPIGAPGPLRADRLFRIGLFSQAEDNDQVTAFLTDLGQALEQHNRQMELLLIGGNPETMQRYAAKLGEMDALQHRVHYTGILDEPALSAALQSCTIGLTPVPRHAVGKSSSVAAFIGHKKAVAAPYVHPGYEHAGIGFFGQALADAIITKPDYDHIERACHAAFQASEYIAIRGIARGYIHDLDAVL